jgi:hypothetical protein
VSIVAIAMEETPFPHPMQRIVGGDSSCSFRLKLDYRDLPSPQHRQRGIVPQLFVIVHFVSQGQSIHFLGHHFLHLVFDQIRITMMPFSYLIVRNSG